MMTNNKNPHDVIKVKNISEKAKNTGRCSKIGFNQESLEVWESRMYSIVQSLIKYCEKKKKLSLSLYKKKKHIWFRWCLRKRHNGSREENQKNTRIQLRNKYLVVVVYQVVSQEYLHKY